MPSIGDTLREARMRQRLDIADVESRTKIRAKYLRALENEEFGMLPGPTFVKTFLRTYAEALGLDPHVLVETYRANYEPRDEIEALQPLGPPAPGRDRRRPGPPRGPRGPWLAIGAAIAVVLVTLLVIGLVGGSGNDNGRPAAQNTSTQPHRKKPKTQHKPQPAPTTVVLRVTPSVPTYVCVDNGAGTGVVFEGIIQDAQTWRGKRVRLNLGKTSVELRKNGKVVNVPGGPNPVGFDFTPTSTKPLPVGERPCA
jgi:cytoskeleton protein RodZ